ncbi:MAG TPA: hypothetical protein VIY73_22490, partial [Polyangiaceae bacterium]
MRRLAVGFLCVALAGCSALWGVADPIVDADAGDATAPDAANGDGSVEGGVTPDGAADGGNDATASDAPSTNDQTAPDASDEGDAENLPDTSADASDADAADSACGIVVDVTDGVLVYGANGTDAPSCGAVAAPCKTLHYGLAQAVSAAPPKTRVYVAAGTYAEAVTLLPGVTIVGGLDVGNGVVTTTCNATPHAEVTIASPTSPAVLADTLGGNAGLETLTVQAPAS